MTIAVCVSGKSGTRMDLVCDWADLQNDRRDERRRIAGNTMKTYSLPCSLLLDRREFVLSSSGPGPGPRSGPGQVPGQVQKVQGSRTKTWTWAIH